MGTGLQDALLVQRRWSAHVEKIELLVGQQRCQIGVAAHLREEGVQLRPLGGDWINCRHHLEG